MTNTEDIFDRKKFDEDYLNRIYLNALEEAQKYLGEFAVSSSLNVDYYKNAIADYEKYKQVSKGFFDYYVFNRWHIGVLESPNRAVMETLFMLWLYTNDRTWFCERVSSIENKKKEEKILLADELLSMLTIEEFELIKWRILEDYVCECGNY